MEGRELQELVGSLPGRVTGLLAPGVIPPEVVDRDLLVMLALTLALFIMDRTHQTHGVINRTEGAVLLASFVAYQGWLIWDTYRVAPL